MAVPRKRPDDPLAFIQKQLRQRHVYWTYHVNVRLAGRYITRQQILDAVGSYEVVESYSDDKYLPSYLLMGAGGGRPFHVLVGADVEGDNVRVVTAYHPDPAEWEGDLRTRRTRP